MEAVINHADGRHRDRGRVGEDGTKRRRQSRVHQAENCRQGSDALIATGYRPSLGVRESNVLIE
jgi:hypothetical protein